MAETLYQRILGDDFKRLPPQLRRFHAMTDPGQWRGRFTITGGDGLIRGLMLRALRLPLPGENVETLLRITTIDSGELWMRQFGDRMLRTRQWQEGGLLIEEAGPMRFAFRLAGDEQGMRFATDHTRILGVRMPRRFSVHIDATVRGLEAGWHVTVTIALPLLGTILTYSGKLREIP
jgi:hypothetical protein